MQESDRQAETKWAEAENIIVSNREKEKKRQELNEAIQPSRRPLHKAFLLVSFVTSCAAMAMLIGQILGAVFQSNGPVEYVLRIYTMVLCIVCIMVEYEWTAFGRESKILHYWITRGLYYSFIGVLGLDQIDNSGDANTKLSWSDVAHNYIFVVAWAILLCGCLYFFMGIVCLQIVYDKLRKDYDERCQQAPNVRQTINTYQEANNV